MSEMLYGHNREILKKYRPDIYEEYQGVCRKNKERKTQVSVITAKDGTDIFNVKKGDRSVRLNSLYAPKKEAEKWVSQFACDNYNINAIIFGLGNGIFVAELQKKLQSDSKIFIYEPCIDIFEAAMKYVDLEGILSDERVFLFIDEINGDNCIETVNSYTHWTSLETQISAYHPGYDQIFSEKYRDFLTSMEKMLRLVLVNKDTQEYFAERMVLNMLKNLKYLKESRVITDYVSKIPHDVPAIIVAAGPSLDKNIEELKRAKGKAFILAVDTAMRHLLQHNIMPDAMVTMDPAKPYEYMNDPRLQDIPLFCILEANHEIMEFHKGIKIWIRGGSFLGELFSHYGLKFGAYNPGGSVATAAFSVCVALEFQRIILVGQDLAYQGNLTHAGGEKVGILNEEQGIKYVDGIDGEKVKSRHDWIIYLEWFEGSIKCVSDRTEVIDATEGGAMIHGSTVMRLCDVIERYCDKDVDFESILKSQSPALSVNQYQKVKKEICGYVPELKKLLKTAEDAEGVCNEALELLEDDPENIKLDILKEKVHIATQRIGGSLVYEIVDIYMSRVVDKYLSGIFVVSDDKRADEMNVYLSSKVIFQGLQHSIKKLLPYFEKAAQEV